MKYKMTVIIFMTIITLITCNSQSIQDKKLLGTWVIIEIDKNGQASDLMNSIMSLYGIDMNDPSVIEMYDDIMVEMINIIRALNFKITFTSENEYKTEIMGQRTVNKYKINRNTIIIDQNGVINENDFEIEDNKLYYAGFIWEKSD